MASDPSSFSHQLAEFGRGFWNLNIFGQAIAIGMFFSCLPFLIPMAFVFPFLAIPLMLYLRWTCGMNRNSNRLEGKTALVTGGNSGIGKEIVYDLAKRGARVIIAARRVDVSQEVADEIKSKSKNSQVFVKKLDLSSMDDIRRFVDDFQTTERRLDILINNAGVSMWNKEVNLTADKLERQMATNYFGPFRLTQLLMDKLKESSGRIINASSSLHWRVYNLDLDNLDFHKKVGSLLEIYSVSKLCVILFTRLLAKRLQGTGVTVNCYHPGVVDTPIHDQKKSWANVLLWIPRRFFFKTPYQGAQTALYLATSDEVKDVTGEYFADCKMSTTSKLAQDMDLAQRLWDKTEAVLTRKD